MPSYGLVRAGCGVVRNRIGFSKIKHFIVRSGPAGALTPTRLVTKERESPMTMTTSIREGFVPVTTDVDVELRLAASLIDDIIQHHRTRVTEAEKIRAILAGLIASKAPEEAVVVALRDDQEGDERAWVRVTTCDDDTTDASRLMDRADTALRLARGEMIRLQNGDLRPLGDADEEA
jgi:hypothetical protein